jgi:hypothetical protein
MSLSTIALDSSWVDYAGDWASFIEPLIAPLEAAGCHAPRLALVPDISNQLVPVSGKITFNFYLVPGSFVVGFWLIPNLTGALQITDVNLGHKFFQAPADVTLLTTLPAEVEGALYQSVMLLPTPHPVVGEGLFTLEFWGTVADRFYLVLLVAEVFDCQT